MRLSLDKLVGFWKNATPNAIAVATPLRKLTYRQLYDIVHKIDISSLDSTQRYGIIISDNISYLIAILALMSEGIVFVNIGLTINQIDLKEFVRANSITHIITDNQLSIEDCEIVQFSDLVIEKDFQSLKDHELTDIVGGFLSSGSTGTPKVFFRSQYSLISEALMWIMELQLSRGQSFYLSQPFSYIGSFVLMYSVLYSGGCVVVNDNSSEGENALTRQDHVNFAFFTPGLIRKMICTTDAVSIDNVITMGAPISTEEKKRLAQLYKCNVYEMWGNSEGLATITNMLDNPDCNSLGRATFTDEIYIVDKFGSILPNKSIGWIAGVTDNVTSADSEKSMIVSGDMGFLDEQNNLHFVGREGEVIVFQDGFFFSCLMLSNKIRERIKIHDLAIVLIENNVYCFLETDHSCSDVVIEVFNELYGRYSKVVSLAKVIYRTIPYNANGKVDYEELKKECNVGAVDRF